jgi:hypothetical protein
MVSVYKLVDPRDLYAIPMYIGKSRNMPKRFSEHLRKPHSAGLRRWMKKLRRHGILPKLVVLRVVDDSEWKEIEKQELTNARKINPEILNVVEAGADGPPHDLAVQLGRHMAKIAFQRNPERYKERGKWLARNYSQTEEGRIAAGIRGKKNIITAQATMRESYYGTERQLRNASNSGKIGVRAAQNTLRNGYWKTEHCRSQNRKAGRLRAEFTNHKRWHLDRGKRSDSCRLCVS